MWSGRTVAFHQHVICLSVCLSIYLSQCEICQDKVLIKRCVHLSGLSGLSQNSRDKPHFLKNFPPNRSAPPCIHGHSSPHPAECGSRPRGWRRHTSQPDPWVTEQACPPTWGGVRHERMEHTLHRRSIQFQVARLEKFDSCPFRQEADERTRGFHAQQASSLGGAELEKRSLFSNDLLPPQC